MKIAVMAMVWALSLASAAAATPDGQSGVYHQSWTKKDGAPEVVFRMTQDSLGMLWFTSTSGLYHFDGARFGRTDAIDGNRLSSTSTNLVTAIGDALWVGYTFGGLSVFEHGSVRHYGVAEGMPKRSVYNLARTGDGRLWVATSAGLHWKDGERWRQVGAAEGLAAGMISSFTALPDGTLLVYHETGLYRSIAGTRRFVRALAQRGIETGFLRHDGRVLLVSTEHQLQLFDPATGGVTPLPLPAGSATPINVTQDARDAIWISTEQGMQQLGPDLRPQRTFAGHEQLSGKLIYTDYNDREGNLWFATENGIDVMRKARLTTVALPARMIGALSVVAAGDGTVWIGNTPTTGGYRDTSIAIAADGRRVTSPIRRVSATLRDPDGSVWFAGDGGVWHQQGQGLQRWELPPALRADEVQALAKGRDGRLWVSIVRRGVGTFDNGLWQPGGGHAELADNAAVSLHADAQGRVWFGYPDNSLAVLDAGVVRRFDARDGLAVGNVLAMSSRSGQLWIGGSEGVARLRGKRFVMLGGDDGAPLYGVAGMVETGAGELWLHDADGLVRVASTAVTAALRTDVASVAMERFDYLDGHQGSPSAIRPLSSLSEAPDGRLWYASAGSVGWIDPAQIARNALAPTPQVTALRTDGGNVALRGGVTLPEHTTSLQIDFTAAALSIPERVRFRYRLIGLEGAWHDAGVRRQVFYTNLGPGDYHFEVIAANEDGLWSKAPATLDVRIAPSLTQTLWFKLAVAALALGALYLLYLARLARLTARIAERLRERVLERERIARTLHDTFLQSVHALILRVDLIKDLLPSNAPAQQQIDAALSAAQRVVDEGVEQMMDLRAKDPNPDELSEALRAAGAALTRQYGVQFTLTVVGAERALRPMVCAETLAIGKEALLNAARHAGGAPVTAELAYASRHFRLTVRDHGNGLDDSVRKSGMRPGHYGLQGMRERAQRIDATFAIDSRAKEGTVVTLTVPAGKAYD
jgi:signal transduction histidine kinase/ligand-binding sensor domain-containing protein